MVGCCQAEPDRSVASVVAPSLRERLASCAPAEILHQKVSVPGPVMVVCKVEDCELLIMPVWAAARPSCVVVVWANQGALALVVQVKFVALSASPRVCA